MNDFLNKESYYNTKYLTNGFVNTGSSVPPVEKQNIILTVGRIGTYQKNTEVLLDAIKNINLLDWKVIIIGPIEESFIPVVDDFFLNAPNLKEKVEFTGNISSRELLDTYYAKSKVFVLTSRYESFGLVLVEALAHGNFLVSSDLLPAQEISGFGKFGELFPVGDSQKLASILQSIIDEKMPLPSKENIIAYADENYDWSVLVKRLYELLESK
ncbi:glycosyltransferase family 4 protein [Chryseobacterium sp. CH1]|uniref:glycosyltransferase family 4 protein n=1 Tax=Chryseobacterium sp. CH1 TaxID=713551 RepID=UPI001E426F37|nr:glycosyltransferase family 4 protein [Chryseobacterium sp. CH1]